MLKKQVVYWVKITFLFLLTCPVGCAPASNKADPFEKINRSFYAFNRVADRLILKPFAKAYEEVLPRFIRIPISNFLQNLSEVPNVGNDLLQGNISFARADTARFIINSTWGLGGLLDLASMGGLERHQQDFGLTMAHWGYKRSAYFVIPFFGPSTFRDGLGRVATYFMGIPPYIRDVPLRNWLYVANVIDVRASLLKAEPVLGEAVDEYVFVRDAFLQHRAYLSTGENPEATAESPKLEGPPE